MPEGKICTDLAWLCWINEHEGAAAWVQAVLVVVTAVFPIVLWRLDGRRHRSEEKQLKATMEESLRWPLFILVQRAG